MTHHNADPSHWVLHHAEYLVPGSSVLDLACGAGRHARLFLMAGHSVTAVDRDLSMMEELRGIPHLELLERDLEKGEDFPFQEGQFGGIVVTNYLHRPLLSALVPLLAPQGVLIYETFMEGNEAYGRPKNPDFLLKPQELLGLCFGSLRVLSYEEAITPVPSKVQRICAIKE